MAVGGGGRYVGSSSHAWEGRLSGKVRYKGGFVIRDGLL